MTIILLGLELKHQHFCKELILCEDVCGPAAEKIF